MIRPVRWLLAVVARSSGIRTLFVVTPMFVLGAALFAYGFVMACFALLLGGVLGFLAFSPCMLAGEFLICLGLATTIALRRADRTVGGFFEERRHQP